MYDESRGRVGNNVISNEEKAKVSTIFLSLGRFTPASFYTNRIPLLEMPTELIEAVRKGKLHYTKARKLARVRDPEARASILNKVLAEGLTVTELDQAVKESLNQHEGGDNVHEIVRSLKSKLSAARITKLNAEDRRRASTLIEELRSLLL